MPAATVRVRAMYYLLHFKYGNSSAFKNIQIMIDSRSVIVRILFFSSKKSLCCHKGIRTRIIQSLQHLFKRRKSHSMNPAKGYVVNLMLSNLAPIIAFLAPRSYN